MERYKSKFKENKKLLKENFEFSFKNWNDFIMSYGNLIRKYKMGDKMLIESTNELFGSLNEINRGCILALYINNRHIKIPF